jgi:Carboxypeptidase regulatory-like domain
MLRRLLFAALLILPTTLLPRSLAAQTVRITVTDQATGGPVAGAMVRVETAEGMLVRAGFTNANGVVRLRTREGRFRVGATRSGYVAGQAEVQVGRSGEATLAMRLRTSPLTLDTLRVVTEATGPELGRQTFERRRSSGRGVFLDSAYVAQKRATWPGDLLYSVPDIDVFASPRDPFGYRRPHSTRGWRCLRTLVDGLPYYGGWPRWVPLEQALRRSDIVSIEVYRDFDEVPRELQYYAWGDRRCGLVLYWTRLGFRTRARGF